MNFFRVRREEWAALSASFGYFFLLLACYYTLRPLRDALGAGIGATNLRWAFLATFGTMLIILPIFGWLASRLPRRRLLPVSYLFFLGCMGVFRVLFSQYEGTFWLGMVFFVWLSVFNVFVVSIFWSFMADIYSSDQAQRLFGPIAAGGSLGAIVGPILTGQLVTIVGVANLFVIAAVLLSGALLVALKLLRLAPDKSVMEARKMGGGALEGATLAAKEPYLRRMTAFMYLGTFTGSLLYLLQIQTVGQLDLPTDQTTALFAAVDRTVNVLTVILQILLTGRMVGWLGFGITLSLLPLIGLAGFTILTLSPILWLIIGLQVLRRSTLFAVTNPVSHMLFAAMGPKSKYKFKNFLETTVYRAGDSSGSWLFAGVIAAGGGLAAVAAIGAGASLIWARVSHDLGQRFVALRDGEKVLP